MDKNIKNFDFITMADEKYSLPLFTSIKQSLKFYPDSNYYVYDCGLEENTKQKLSNLSSQVKIPPPMGIKISTSRHQV